MFDSRKFCGKMEAKDNRGENKKEKKVKKIKKKFKVHKFFYVISNLCHLFNFSI